MYSIKLIDLHFWLATIGVLLYITAMWISGIVAGLMWRAFDDYGNLKYAFVEAVQASHYPYIMRAMGGMLFLSGTIIMCYNVYKTVRSGSIILEGGEKTYVPAGATFKELDVAVALGNKA